MDEIEVVDISEIETESPVLVEGLPGVGHVGKLVAEHLVEEFESRVVQRIYSQHFPPQCAVGEDGTTELVCAELYECEVDGVETLVLTGDHQSQTLDGHYKITECVLDTAEEADVERIYALGGVATGELVEEYNVVGAANSEELVEEIAEHGVEFGEGEPEGGIVGVSGLLLGLGELRGIEGVCLMGETSGYLVDPKSAQAVLEVLTDVLGFEVDTAKLEERAEEMEEVVKRLEEMNTEMDMGSFPSDDDLRYIG
ncbi:MAG: proteasome assembly chaperone family protein [Halobacteriales archaeon]|nr:proteasome assembly chaperone family protein [Halobacteriales archaeon]